MTEFLNSYQAPKPDIAPDAHAETPTEQYDHNYVFEVKTLRSDRVELRPFIPSLHAVHLHKALTQHPELQRWLPLVVKEMSDTLTFVEAARRDSTRLMHAVYTEPLGAQPGAVKPEDYEFAGVMSMVNSSREDMVSEPGFIMIIPQYQRTHVLTHAAGALLHRIMDSPAKGGLGLRRCQWFTTTLNQPSQNAGTRLGFKFEGIIRNHRVLPAGKEGVRDGRPGSGREECMSRDSWLASITWTEWEESVKDHVDKLMARRS